jgi:propionyl-CoA carboxylase alpha chain
MRSVLVANRGEIARRVFRTCRDLGLATVAVFSDADASAPHVTDADTAVRLPGNIGTDTYLRGDLIIDAARRAGADAVHPGYGFLAENASFARAVEVAGLIWIGPPPEAIESMGSKVEAKKVMAAAGVPVLDDLDPDALTAADLPVLIKASAGGGGRGMRIVRDLDELPAQLDAARSEAASAFGDATVFCEPYLEAGRHIEVQVMADQYASVWAIGERECSIQRRHQKVIEEAPSPLVERTPGMRERLFDAARAAASAIGYVSAGTVEFLADESGHFFFLEMNTRLQVEHPVTECTTGLDLVRLQVQIADGARLPATPPESHGHAIEARLYAENPAHDWQPQSGTLYRFDVPSHDGLRVDSGVVDGSAVSVYYDPLLAKIISWQPARDAAATTLARALARAEIHGLRTNRDLLVNVLRHEAFLAGRTDTAFLDRHDVYAPLAEQPELSALAAALADAAANRAAATVMRDVPSGWRNVPSQPQQKHYIGHDVEYRLTRDGLISESGARLVSAEPHQVTMETGGVRRVFRVARYPGLVCVDSPLGPVALTPLDRFPDPTAAATTGSLTAPMPGTVARIAVAVGDTVEAGQPLLWLEAMKMEHAIDAPAGGVVAELPVAVGTQIDLGTVLAIVKGKRS